MNQPIGSTTNWDISGQKPNPISCKEKKMVNEEILEMVRELLNKSESRSAELECSQDGYEFGVKDVIKILINLNN